jgi:head-tail adaptor
MKPKPFAATLKQKIYILENSSQQQFSENWQLKYTHFAQVKQIAPNVVRFFENVNFGALIDEDYTLFRFRFNCDVHKNMRIKFKEQMFVIKKIINVMEQNKLLEIIAIKI